MSIAVHMKDHRHGDQLGAPTEEFPVRLGLLLHVVERRQALLALSAAGRLFTPALTPWRHYSCALPGRSCAAVSVLAG
jgi:hypothetical protein